MKEDKPAWIGYGKPIKADWTDGSVYAIGQRVIATVPKPPWWRFIRRWQWRRCGGRHEYEIRGHHSAADQTSEVPK